MSCSESGAGSGIRFHARVFVRGRFDGKYSTEHRKLEPRALQKSMMQIQEDVLQILELVESFN